MTDDEKIELKYTTEHSVFLTRAGIEDIASGHLSIWPDPGLVDACRQWFADNPATLTQKQRDRLPPGATIGNNEGITHVKTKDGWILIGNSGAFASEATKVWSEPQGVFVPLTDQQINKMVGRPAFVGPMADELNAFREVCDNLLNQQSQ